VKHLWVIVLVTACTQPTGSTSQALSMQVKIERYTLIRDTAAEMGVYNAALLAGIAISETGLAHCQSEATYACQGPASPSCGGGPIIAGSADGPCPQMQGGLGMFQFDAGTYTDTVNTYGPQILTIEGNSAQAVSFVVDKVVQDVANTNDWLGATGWMNDVPLVAGDPLTEEWAALIACRYNGCCSMSSTCMMRAAAYRDNAITAFDDMGGVFWHTADRCAGLPDDGVIDQRSSCYLAGGDPRYWHREAAGYGGGLEWTQTTAAAEPSNFAEWIVKAVPGRYHVEVQLDGGVYGQSKQARYEIAHAGAVDAIVVDQTTATGFVPLGDFDFAGANDEHVRLDDNTGEAGSTMTRLGFDAIRVTPVDGPPPPEAPGGCGCTSSGGGVGGLGGLVVIAIGLGWPRRRKSIG
jgi:hypothetical protein